MTKTTHFLSFAFIFLITLISLKQSNAQDGITVQIERKNGTTLQYEGLINSRDGRSLYGISNRDANAYVTKFDQELNIVWSKAFNNEYKNAKIDQLVVSEGSEIILLVINNSERYIVVLNQTGNVISNQKILGDGFAIDQIKLSKSHGQNLASIGVNSLLDSTRSGLFDITNDFSVEKRYAFTNDSGSYEPFSTYSHQAERAVMTGNDLYIFDQNNDISFSLSFKKAEGGFGFYHRFNILGFNDQYIILRLQQGDFMDESLNILFINRNSGKIRSIYAGNGNGYPVVQLEPNNKAHILIGNDDPYSDYWFSSYTRSLDNLVAEWGFHLTPEDCGEYDCTIERASALSKQGDFTYFSISGSIDPSEENRFLCRIRNSSDFCFDDVDLTESFEAPTDSYIPETVINSPDISEANMSLTLEDVDSIMIDAELIRTEICTVLGKNELFDDESKLQVINGSINIPDNLSMPVNLEIYSVDGKRLYQKYHSGQQIDIGVTQQYAAGIYLIRVEDSNSEALSTKLFVSGSSAR